jgi:D-alanyl-D-alanine carboxypeptidase/D-alanyl-D-alanine-endopeptidase (penicillin-binding protein 4)
MRICFKCLLLILLLPSCAIFKSRINRSAQKIKHEVAHSPTFSKAFTGFTLLDPSTGKTLADYNGERYFTPASNTKIFTLATCLEVLGDSVSGLRAAAYKDGADTINYLKPTGDPTFLHPEFAAWKSVFQFLEHCYGPTTLDLNHFEAGRFGPGWAWDDYNEDYSPERSPMPIFGNTIKIQKTDSNWQFFPFNDRDRWGWNLFREGTIKDLPDYKSPLREEQSNIVYLSKDVTIKPGFSAQIPFITRPYVVLDLLKDTTGKNNISILDSYFKEEERVEDNLIPDSLNWRSIYSTPIDTVLRRMMYQSDNFIAEQMLIVCSSTKFDLLQQDSMIQWMLDSVLTSLPQRPKWVDGSGLSRYNLMTPQSIAQVLQKLWKAHTHERILSLFPAGGVAGTLSEWYAGKDGKPYVFAKTGSMGGVHCLSGYVVCKSGKTLIFSFMHNNFVGSNRAWKLEMQRILEKIYDLF